MTKAQAFDAILARYDIFVTESMTHSAATWDNADEDFKEDIASALKAAGGDPQGKPRRRPGS